MKKFYEPAALEDALTVRGRKGHVQTTGRFFSYGCLAPDEATGKQPNGAVAPRVLCDHVAAARGSFGALTARRLPEEPQMTNRLKIMAQAEEARLVLEGYDSREGERLFSELLRSHPQDGMIFFKRGEAYETVGQPEKALKDFQVAEVNRTGNLGGRIN